MALYVSDFRAALNDFLGHPACGMGASHTFGEIR
jgi:hypothetical protein